MAGSRKAFWLEETASRDMTKCSELMFRVSSVPVPLLLMGFHWESGFLGEYSLKYCQAFCFRSNWEITLQAFTDPQWGHVLVVDWSEYHSALLRETIMYIMLSVAFVGMSMSAESWSLTEEAKDEVCFCWRLCTTLILSLCSIWFWGSPNRWMHELHCLSVQK